MSKKFNQIIFAIFLLSIVIPCFAAGANKTASEYGNKELALITRITSRLLSKNHYRQQPLDENLSRQLFDEYLDELDPAKLYFTQEDVASLAADRDKLCVQLQNGDSSFAFKAYDVFRKRINEFCLFGEKRLKTPFDFTLNDSFTPDRRKLPRAKDLAELEKLWDLRLKSDVLSYRLMNRIQSEERAQNAKNLTNDDKKREETASKWEIKKPEERVLSRLRDISNEITQKDVIDILGIYLNSLAQVYGPHSNYYAPKLEEDFEMAMNLTLSGIGATLSREGGYIKIVGFTPGGPAALDGRLKVEDRIIAVAQDGEEPVDVIDMPLSKAVQLIRGPEKSKVTLTILPGEKGRSAVPETITIVRDKIVLAENEAKGAIRTVKAFDGKERKIGIITLPSFYMDFESAMKGVPDFKSCTRDVKKILADFKKDKVDAVIMDLRRNGGGSLPEAITLTGLFIPSGPVVQIRSANQKISVKSDNDGEQIYAGPLVILNSKLSASAAEIFSAAIRDCQRGILVGDSRTFGKGTVLDVVPIDRYLKYIGENFKAGSATYETAMFFRTAGGSVQQLGIASDIQLPSLTEHIEVGEMFMDNHLPWDSIRPLPDVKPYIADFDTKVAKLKELSEARIAKNTEYGAFLKKLELYNKYKERNSVSLNEETRWKEYREEKQLQDESDKLYEDRLAGATKKENSGHDLVLTETANIAADFSELK
ncbi:MAG: carboxy terminal-processing peptidase [Victivallales bacterium]|jgi:carboxyl-terminal processing protease|nr:carboxy terminal-processing peptidase [Victivallales bacterium]